MFDRYGKTLLQLTNPEGEVSGALMLTAEESYLWMGVLAMNGAHHRT